jgi:hypothetical protein
MNFRKKLLDIETLTWCTGMQLKVASACSFAITSKKDKMQIVIRIGFVLRRNLMLRH